MEIKVEKSPNNTYKVDITVEKEKVEKHINDALEHEAHHIEISGFRKGKAPLKLVKEKVDAAKLRSHALNHLLEEIYPQIIKENKMQPIVYPRFEIKEFEEGKDLKLTMIIIEKPDIKLGDYKKAIKTKLEKSNKDEPLNTQDVVDAILSVSEVAVADQLIDEETNRMVSALIDQTSKMGVTMDQYLQSVGKKPEDVRNQYKDIASKNIKSDFVVTEIASKEGIEVSDSEIDITINAVPDAASREALSKPEQKMYIKAVLLKNKTLQSLAEEAKPKDNKKIDEKEEKSK